MNFLVSLLIKKCLGYYQITHRFLGESLANNIKTTRLDKVISNINNINKRCQQCLSDFIQKLDD